MSPSKSRRRRPRKNKSNNKKIILIVALLAVVVTIVVGYSMLGNNNPNENVPNGDNTSNKMKVLFETSMGNITIRLREDMLITVGNFKNLTQQGVYDNTVFHRVISGFMIQGGVPTGTGYGDPSIPAIIDEFSETPENNKNIRGTIAMANAGPNTGSSQFFINVVDNNNLNNIHPVFGDIIEGMNIVDKIRIVVTNSDDEPLEDVKLIRATLID